MKKVSSFEAIPGTEPLIELPEEIVKQMSTDASLSYKLLCAIRSGELSPELSSIKFGNIVHSRWLTTGQSIMMLWMSEHTFKGEILQKFRMIFDFVCNVYFQMFFEIKVKHSIVEGLEHNITFLWILHAQPPEVVKAVSPYVQSGAWSAHPEALLITLLLSKKKKERRFAVKKVLEVRGDEELGDTEPRSRLTLKLNFQAKKCQDLIACDKVVIH